MLTLAQLRSQFPHRGEVKWIGLRTSRDEAMSVVPDCNVVLGAGLEGDRFASRHSDKRAVTLIQFEHLAAIAAFLDREVVDPANLRRNLVVSGLNLLSLKGQRFRIGEAVLEHTGACHPCSKMEQRLGPGAYNAMRGHGGITARVIQEGTIQLGDSVTALPEAGA